MRKYLLMLAIFVLLMSLIPVASAAPIELSMNTLPDAPWELNNDQGAVSVADGILTIDSPSWCEYILSAPEADWVQNADNAKGWIMETRMQVDPSTVNLAPTSTYGSVQLSVEDGDYTTTVGWGTDRVYIAQPDRVDYLMDTAHAFHTYRVEARGSVFKLYVDDTLAIDYYHQQRSPFERRQLFFGDGLGGADYPSKSYWDYLMYDTAATFPTVSATIDFDPDTLNKKSKGQFVNCYIELPEGYNAEDIVNSMLTEVNGISITPLAAESCPSGVGDYDNDGIADLMVKFDRGALQAVVSPGDTSLAVTGLLTDLTRFEGTNTIRIIDKGIVHADEPDPSSVEY